MATITAPGRVSRRATTPILLPESDMACWLTVIAISPDGGPQGAAEWPLGTGAGGMGHGADPERSR